MTEGIVEFLIPTGVGMGVTAYLLVRLVQVAPRLGLVDAPGHRKTQSSPVAAVGGISIFIGFILALAMAPFGLGEFRVLLIGSGLLVLMGVLDDIQGMSARLKFFSQVVVVSFVVVSGDVVIHSIGDIFNWRDGNEQGLGWVSKPLTIIAILCVINAYNFIDGLDGLAGSLAIVSIASLLFLIAPYQSVKHETILILLISCIAVFLVFNLGILGERMKVYLGDAGSMFLGFVVAFFAIDLVFDGASMIKSTAMPWIIGLPVLDLISVVILRYWRKLSVTSADANHIHHHLQKTGSGSTRCLLIILGLHTMLCFVGVAGSRFSIPDWVMFWSLPNVALLYVWWRISLAIAIEKNST